MKPIKTYIAAHSITVGILAAAVVLAVIAALFFVAAKTSHTIDTYQACENAGGRIAESYPTQCFIDGKSFVNDAQKLQ